MLTINAKHNSVWTSTVFDNVLLKSIRVWLSGLRLYLQSDRDKTLQLPTIPSVYCHTILQNLEVQICGNFQPNNLKIMPHLTKTETSLVICHMAQYCHNSCSKCPLFAHTHARRHPRHSPLVNFTVNDGLVSAMPNKQKTLLQFTTLVCYLQRTFNRKMKLEKISK